MNFPRRPKAPNIKRKSCSLRPLLVTVWRAPLDPDPATRFPGNLPKKRCSTPPRSALRAQTAQCCEPWFADVTHDAYVEFLHSCLLLLRRNRAARKPAVVRVLLRERARLPRERARG
jgi:hypothetical protein